MEDKQKLLIDLPKNVLKIIESKGKKEHRKRKQQIEHILIEYSKKK